MVSKSVALLAEGVDRNKITISDMFIGSNVALLAEGVDRNKKEAFQLEDLLNGSPSSRRAWIEIGRARPEREPDLVALLAEGVDRNVCQYFRKGSTAVALLAEGVDRNLIPEVYLDEVIGRPPRGGRG